MLMQLITIGRNTFIESIRQPIFAVLILVGALALTLNPSLIAYTLDDDNKMLLEVGLSMILVIQLFLAAFTAAGVVSEEIEQKTVLTVVSKPVSRPLFILGKYLGVSAAMAVAFWCLSAIYLLTLRHGVMQTASDPFDQPVLTFGLLAGLVALLGAALGNYFYHWVFTSTFVGCLTVFITVAWGMVLLINKQWQFQPPTVDLNPQLLVSLLLVFQAVLILAAVAIAASTRLGQIMTLVICAVVFALGVVGEYFDRLADRVFETPADLPLWSSAGHILTADQSAPAKLGGLLAKLMHLCLPNLQYTWPADALIQGHAFSGRYVVSVTGYCGLYILAVLALAVALFQTREVG